MPGGRKQRCVWGMVSIPVHFMQEIDVKGGIGTRDGKGSCGHSRKGFDSWGGQFPFNSVSNGSWQRS